MAFHSLVLSLLFSSAYAFCPTPFAKRIIRDRTNLFSSSDLGFTPWKPEGGGEVNQYGSTDTPDYFDDDNNAFDKEMAAESQSDSTTKKLEDQLRSDSWTIGGIEKSDDCPNWYNARPMSVPDGVLEFPSSGHAEEVIIANGAMGYEDFYAGLSEDIQGSWKIEPVSGTLNKRGGDPQPFTIKYLGSTEAKGEVGHLVIMTEEEKWSYVLKLN